MYIVDITVWQWFEPLTAVTSAEAEVHCVNIRYLQSIIPCLCDTLIVSIIYSNSQYFPLVQKFLYHLTP